MNTRLVTCHSSKEHRHLNGIGECEGSMYAIILTSDVPLRNGCYQPSVRKHPRSENPSLTLQVH